MKSKKVAIPVSLRNVKLWKACYTVTLFIGMILIIFEVFIYRRTMITPIIPISIILGIGTVAFLLNKEHYKATYSLNGNFYPFMQNIISWGFISCYIFMSLNYYFADPATQVHRFVIANKDSMPGTKGRRHERSPTVTFDYFNLKKELVFDYSDTDRILEADSVTVSIRKGALGFDVLESYDSI